MIYKKKKKKQKENKFSTSPNINSLTLMKCFNSYIRLTRIRSRVRYMKYVSFNQKYRKLGIEFIRKFALKSA